MKRLVRWAIANSPAMNTLMVGLLVVGAFSMYSMRREVFPNFDLEILLVTVPYPGASPAEVEEGICQKIEEAVYSIENIKKVTSVAREGAGFVIIELDANVPDVQRVLAEVRSEVDRIPSWPELAEDAEVEQITTRNPAIFVGLTGPDVQTPQAELELRNLTEQIRDEMLQLPHVSQANIVGAKDYQIDIEIPEETLRKYGLSLGRVADIVRRENVEIPGGSMRTKSEELLLRGKNKHLTGEEIAKIPLVTQPGGAVLTVGDLGAVRDEFSDSTSISSITVVPTDENGRLQAEPLPPRPALAISIDRTSSEDLLTMVDEVKQFVAERSLPPGYELHTWWDQSVNVKDRMDLLIKNGAQGLLLVFIVLALFLELRLAFWVAMGIPVSILGSGIILLYTDQTINMLTMFAFLMALGIIVDDAIVVGENIYSHRQRGKDIVTAAVDGTAEVIPSVTASVLTTVIAFMPLFFVSGVMGKFIAVMPLAVVGMLAISWFESMMILPCHLGHTSHGQHGAVEMVLRLIAQTVFFPLLWFEKVMRPVNRTVTRGLNWFIKTVYLPLLRRSVNHPSIVVAIAIGILIVAAGFMRSGRTPFQIMPELDSYLISATVRYPDGTPAEFTDRATQQIEAAIRQVHEKYAAQGMPLMKISHRTVGYRASMEMNSPQGVVSDSHVGGVNVELVDTSQRSIHSEQVLAEWREAAGQFPGAESITFGTPQFGPGGTPIEFKLVADPEHFDEVEAAAEVCKDKLAEYEGVFDIEDDSDPGKWEFQLTVKDKAKAMGVPLADLAETVRSAYYGAEVMRLQRGRHEVKLMVRYPREDRHTLATFDEIRVQTPDGAQRPITELANVQVERGCSEFNRIDQKRSITVSA
ncbi:MAG: efflux RND transporter permease subunit, partial [Planctomycetales bacterium]|nr:efflux RND transporter permease subunit [Planctomycetales bacterium]